MKKIILISCIALASCSSHDHSTDKVIGNIHEIHLKEMASMKKHIIDSMKTIIPLRTGSGSEALNKTGWYSSTELKLPPGTAIDFNPSGPTDLTQGKGPYFIIIKGFDGKKTINKVNYDKWLMITTGDIIK